MTEVILVIWTVSCNLVLHYSCSLLLIDLWTESVSKSLFSLFLDCFLEIWMAGRCNILNQLKLLEVSVALPLTLHHSILVVALQTLNFTRMSILFFMILKLFVNPNFPSFMHSWRLLSYLMINCIVILSSDSESLPLISLNMLTHVLSTSRALKSHRLLPKDLLSSISLGSWVMKIVMLRALFIIRDFLISMLSLGSRAWNAPVWLTILLLFTFTVCFVWVSLIQIAIRLIPIF